MYCEPWSWRTVRPRATSFANPPSAGAPPGGAARGPRSGRRGGGVDADALGRPVVDGDAHGRLALAGAGRGQVGAPHGVVRSGMIVPSCCGPRARRSATGRGDRSRASAAARAAARCGCRGGAASPRPCGGPRRGRGWRPAPPGSPPGGRRPASARPAPAAAVRPCAAAPGGGRRSSARRPRRGDQGEPVRPAAGRRDRPAHRLDLRRAKGRPASRAATFSASSSRSSSISPSRAFSRAPRERLAVGRACRERRLARPSGMRRASPRSVPRPPPQRPRHRLQVLAAQQPQHRLPLALPGHPPAPARSDPASVVSVVMVHLRCGRGPLTRCPVQP